MTAEDYIRKHYIRKLRMRNPQFWAPGTRISISAVELERLLRLAFNAGRQEGNNDKSLFEQGFGKLP